MAACWAQTTSSSWTWDNSGSNLFMGDGMAAAAAAANSSSSSASSSTRNAGNLAIDPRAATAIGLKLGKRIYFEDGSPPPAPGKGEIAGVVGNGAKKRQRGPTQPAAPPSCQVDGCAADLSGSKGYHRRHRVCELHAKAPKSSVKGVEQRFCQQCSRFHGLSHFDEGKRSCRRRLAGHNQRRRKPPPPDPFATIIGGAAGLFSSSGNYMPHSSLSLSANAPPRHLLDGSFIVGKDNWPPSSSSSPRLDHVAAFGQASLMLKTKQEMIASHGVYQFLKCHAAAIAASPPLGSSPNEVAEKVSPLEPQQARMITPNPAGSDALSLLSPPEHQQWGSSPPPLIGNKPMKVDDSTSFQLQLYHPDHHQHHQQQQQQQQRSFSGINELFQFQKAVDQGRAFSS